MRISDWSSRRVLFRSARDLARVRFEQAVGPRLALAVPALGEQSATVREDRRFAAERREFVDIGRRPGADIEQAMNGSERVGAGQRRPAGQIGYAHVCTPVTTSPLVSLFLLTNTTPNH